MKKTYLVTFSVEGYYTSAVEAKSREEAKKLAIEESHDVDCGDIENADWEVCDILEMNLL